MHEHDSPVRSANKRVSSLQGLGIFSRHPEVSWKQNEITTINFMCCGFIGMEEAPTFPIITTVHKGGRKACLISSSWSTCKPSEMPLFSTFQSFIKSPVPDDNYCLPGCIMTLCLRNMNHRGELTALDATAATEMLLLLKNYTTNRQLPYGGTSVRE